MKIDINPLLAGTTDRLQISSSIEPCFPYGIPYALAGVTFTSPIGLEGFVKNSAGLIELSLQVHAEWEGECARCLEPVKGVLDFPFNRTIAAKGTLENEEEIADYSDEYLIADEGVTEPDSEICDAINYEFPAKVLCSEDCPGLCPVCGKPKKYGDCACSLKEHDPRWDVLKQMTFPDSPEENPNQ